MTGSVARSTSSRPSSRPSTRHSTRHSTVVPLRAPVPVEAVQGTLALDLAPDDLPPTAPRSTRPATATPASVHRIDQRARREAERWAWRYVQAVVEIVGGDRPVSQLLCWTDRQVYLDLARRALLVARAGDHQPGVARVQPVRPQVRSVHASDVRPGVMEVSAHVRYGARSRAVAARFEERRGRWTCTALEFA